MLPPCKDRRVCSGYLFTYVTTIKNITTITKYYRYKYKVACHQLFFLRASPSDIFGYSLTPQKSSPILVLVVELEMTVEYVPRLHAQLPCAHTSCDGHYPSSNLLGSIGCPPGQGRPSPHPLSAWASTRVSRAHGSAVLMRVTSNYECPVFIPPSLAVSPRLTLYGGGLSTPLV